ncbi:hypothetical protein SAMN06296378_0902 [Salinibacterium xinjiangense]|uniref:Uncharacterized protein n=1 Tax=Salinibacterium xinjiangense TaxID=386302 RepID=A0A2C8Z636_9MICO|nr:hypothetical protein SAMN06296378_0902 [Salinibacterium xinjiangense]
MMVVDADNPLGVLTTEDKRGHNPRFVKEKWISNGLSVRVERSARAAVAWRAIVSVCSIAAPC